MSWLLLIVAGTWLSVGSPPPSSPQGAFQDPVSTCDQIAPRSGFDGVAELPRERVDTTELDSSAWWTETVCASGCDHTDLQSAYDAAVSVGASEPVRLQVAGGYNAGQLMLRHRGASTNWIYVEPLDRSKCPLAGMRISAPNPGFYQIRGPLVGSNTWSEAIWAEDGAGYTRFICADISVEEDANNRTRSHLVRLRDDSDGVDSTNPDDAPDHIIIDRSYVHLEIGRRNVSNMIGLFGSHQAVIDSFLVSGNCPGCGHSETRGIGAEWGTGPYHVENNYLASSGVQIFLGGSRVHDGRVSSDWTIRRNHFHKPPSWQTDPFGHTVVKNWFQIKSAERVLLECNVFENNWTDSQRGKGILLRSEVDTGRSGDITLRYNRVTEARTFLDMNAVDGASPVQGLSRVRVHNNLIDKMGRESQFTSSGSSTYVIWSSDHNYPLTDIEYVHNTHGFGASGSVMGGRRGAARILVANNLMDRRLYGVKADGTAEGIASMDAMWGAGNYTWDANTMYDATCSRYPAGTDCPTETDLTREFVDVINYELVPGSKYRLGGSHPPTTGRMRGADVNSVLSVTAGVVGEKLF